MSSVRDHPGLAKKPSSRSLVQQGKELYIIAGPVGNSGNIGKKEQITVPAKTWKVILVLDRQGLGMQGVKTNTRTITLDDAQ
ncbi:MAG TPA: hypothetical protein DDZ60_14755 [Planktothrix sp. UBA10369]|nr:hypothetical protein [Microcoleaceae cyanobacterium UBA11344]HBK23709.1 hypothetical protein [Planktothrix sp. UBA10369]